MFSFKLKLKGCYKLYFLFLKLGDWRFFLFCLEVEGVFVLWEVEGFGFFSWRLKVLMFTFKKVKGFCFCSWTLKVFVFTLKKVGDFCFCSRRLKVIIFVLREVEGFYSCFWMPKVFVVSFEYWTWHDRFQE